MASIHLIAWLALLLDAGAGPTPPVPSDSTCSVYGTIFVAVRDTLPEPFVDVRALGTSKSALSDENGRFVLPGLEPGRVILAIRAFGGPQMLDTLNLAAGERRRRDYRIDQAWTRFERRLDSLTASGE